MFGAKKIWRRIHRKVNVRQKRFAIVSAIAASGSPALVMARGHKIDRIREVPLVVDNAMQSLKRTKDAVKFLKKHKVWSDIVRVYKSKHLRAGKGKARNRRWVKALGPLIIYRKNEGCTLAFRNIPGVRTIRATELNLLRLAPGGRVGRFCIWSESAFETLNKLYGTYYEKSEMKMDYSLPMPMMTSADFKHVLKDQNVRRYLRAPRYKQHLSQVRLNPLKNERQMFALNPYAAVEKQFNRENNAEKQARKKRKLERADKMKRNRWAQRDKMKEAKAEKQRKHKERNKARKEESAKRRAEAAAAKQ